MRVLYVDDDRISTLLFVEACRPVPEVQVDTAATGAEALEIARRWSPDLLVIDLYLPDTDGYVLLGALREVLGAPRRPAFLCTADAPASVSDPAGAAGFDGCWTKPIHPRALLEAIERLGAARGAAG